MATSNKPQAQVPGTAASPLIDQQIKKDWGENKNSSTTAKQALGKKHTTTPVRTGSSK
jgi:hypothetical protein